MQGSETKLFLSFIKAHKAVTSSTIARWLRTIIEQAEVNTEIFSAHSTCGASVSEAARGGVTLEDILKQQTGARSQSSRGSTTKRWIRQHTEGLQLIRIAWKELQTTQVMCDTEPSEI